VQSFKPELTALQGKVSSENRKTYPLPSAKEVIWLFRKPMAIVHTQHTSSGNTENNNKKYVF